MITGVFYVAMVVAGYVVELLFTPAGLTPDRASAHLPDAGITWNYTTWLNIAFLILAALLTWRFFRTEGRQMLAMMGGAPTTETQHRDAPATDEAAEHPGHGGNHHQHHGGEKNGK